MAIQSISTGLVDTPVTWTADWAWGLPLIVVIVLLHVLGLAMTLKVVVRIFNRWSQSRRPTVLFVIVTGTATFLATCLHAIEAMIWALAYGLLGAMPHLQAGNTLFAECLDKLRTHQSNS